MCAAHTAPPDLPEPDRLAREAAEHWVRQPTDKNRRAAMHQAEATAFESTPNRIDARYAVFWCGETIGPEDQPPMPPTPHMAGQDRRGRGIAGRACAPTRSRQDARLKRFLESGRNVAAGGPGRAAEGDGLRRKSVGREAKGRQGKETQPLP